MMLLKRAGAAALVAAAVAVGSSAVNAAPTIKAPHSVASADSGLVMKVDDRRDHWRGRYNYRHRHHDRHNGFGNIAPYLGIGIAGALLDGALSDDGDDGYGYADGPRSSDRAMRRCASQFRSFEWDTGMYTTYDGDRRVCPYLG